MERNEESLARVKLAGRFLMHLMQAKFGGGRPVLLSEIAELRFLAESDEELAMPPEQLAKRVIDRERARMGLAAPDLRNPSRN